jgi:hypothetical protein
MFIPPDLATQLAREHYRRMLGEASQRQLAHQHARPAPGTPGPAGITRRLAAAITRARVATARAAGGIWPTGPHPLGEPAGQSQAPDSRY